MGEVVPLRKPSESRAAVMRLAAAGRRPPSQSFVDPKPLADRIEEYVKTTEVVSDTGPASELEPRGRTIVTKKRALEDTQPTLESTGSCESLESQSGAAAGWALVALAFAAGVVVGLLLAGAGMLWLVLP